MTNWLLVNIGNTHTAWALADDAGLTLLTRHPTSDMANADWRPPELPSPAPQNMVGACVVPDAGLRVMGALAMEQHWLNDGLATRVGLDFGDVDPSTVGADRMANAIAALKELALPALVLDCGTAIASVTVDAAGRFRGGFIMPGRQMQRLALHDHTGQLPVVPLADQPPTAIGQSTPACIRAGIDLGVPGAVERILRVTREELGAPSLSAVAIGGDREYLTAQVDGLTVGPDDFTLRGLRHIALWLDKESLSG